MKKYVKLVMTTGLILTLVAGCAKEVDKEVPEASAVAEQVAVEWSSAHNGPDG